MSEYTLHAAMNPPPTDYFASQETGLHTHGKLMQPGASTEKRSNDSWCISNAEHPPPPSPQLAGACEVFAIIRTVKSFLSRLRHELTRVHYCVALGALSWTLM